VDVKEYPDRDISLPEEGRFAPNQWISAQAPRRKNDHCRYGSCIVYLSPVQSTDQTIGSRQVLTSADTGQWAGRAVGAHAPEGTWKPSPRPTAMHNKETIRRYADPSHILGSATQDDLRPPISVFAPHVEPGDSQLHSQTFNYDTERLRPMTSSGPWTSTPEKPPFELSHKSSRSDTTRASFTAAFAGTRETLSRPHRANSVYHELPTDPWQTPGPSGSFFGVQELPADELQGEYFTVTFDWDPPSGSSGFLALRKDEKIRITDSPNGRKLFPIMESCTS
jgi:hypothetical protein